MTAILWAIDRSINRIGKIDLEMFWRFKFSAIMKSSPLHLRYVPKVQQSATH